MKTASVSEMPGNVVEKYGYAAFNRDGQHLCVDLPPENFTISVKTPDGEKITFAFVCRPEGGWAGHQCVDIVHHGEKKNADGNPLQKAAFLGQGPTNYRCDPRDLTPTTVIALNLPKKEPSDA